MEHSIKLTYWLYKSKANKKGLAPLFLRITVNGQKTEVSTGISLLPKQWDNNKALVKGSTGVSAEQNKQLEVMKGKALKIYNELIERGIPISSEQVKRKLLGQDEQAKTLLEALAYHNDQLRLRLGVETKPATITKYETLRKKVTSFVQDHLHRKDIFLRELNHQFIVEFESYLKVTQKISHNPTLKYIQFLKTVIFMSIANGWMQENPFRSFKCSFVVKERGFLTAEELAAIEGLQISIPRLSVIRDLFVFSCYTGLAYVDIKKLSQENIVSQDGQTWIVIHRTKTNVRAAIPMLQKPMELYNKYRGIKDGKSIFPVPSNQKLNAYLKEVQDLAELTKNLTFHLARHTFATTVTLTNGVPIESVSKMLGHTNLKTTQVYAKVVDTKIGRDMQQLRDKLG